jgi:hypothetical protein
MSSKALLINNLASTHGKAKQYTKMLMPYLLVEVILFYHGKIFNFLNGISILHSKI